MDKQLIPKKDGSYNQNNTSEKPQLIPKKKKPAFTERSRLVSTTIPNDPNNESKYCPTTGANVTDERDGKSYTGQPRLSEQSR